MKTQNTKELQTIAIGHSSDIGFNNFMKLYKKCTAKLYSFWINDATIASDNPLCLRRILLERIKKVIMAVDKRVKDKIATLW